MMQAADLQHCPGPGSGDPPWDSESVGLYEDLAAIAGRVLIPGGASGSPFPAGPRKASIAS